MHKLHTIKKKNEIIELVKKYKDVLAKYDLYVTGTTGTLIMDKTGLKIERMNSGPKGGDQQIGAMLAVGELDLIILIVILKTEDIRGINIVRLH